MLVQYTEKQQIFIEEIVKPVLTGVINKEIVSVTYDLNGHILNATNAFAKLYEYYDWQEVIGKSISDLKTLKNDKLTTKLNQIRQKVIKSEKPIYYVLFANFSYGFDAHASYHYPLFMPDGSVVATRVISKKFVLFNPVTLFNQFCINQSKRKKKKIKVTVELSQLEYNIIFLLSIGLTQQEMSFFIKLSRSRLAQLMTNLYTRFKLTNQAELIKFVTENNLITTIPDEFMQPKIIILDSLGNDVFRKRKFKRE